jgi:group I intron endonuclease
MASHNTGIYQIVNKVNGKRYIGSAVRFDNRKRQHFQSLARGDHHSVALQRAWRMYGEESFEFERLLICSKENLIMYEQAYMDAFIPEYNIVPRAGSQLGYKHTEETRKRMSESRPKGFSPMKGKKHTEETKAKISANRKGIPSGEMTPERRAKIGAAHKGRVISPEQRAKISAKLMGHKQSAEQIEKRMQKIRGRRMPEGFGESISQYMRGRTVSDETKARIGRSRAKLSEDQVREVRMLRSKGMKQKEIGQRMGVPQATIADICCGRKYKWVI